ncbi:hypothetical protein, partial [Amantichitinum ursilacus]|uniref:hypothetical protein n=1 Tax=Amantichitinum ursilacus TaxID=857265 RepID=UPI001F43DD4D
HIGGFEWWVMDPRYAWLIRAVIGWVVTHLAKPSRDLIPDDSHQMALLCESRAPGKAETSTSEVRIGGFEWWVMTHPMPG